MRVPLLTVFSCLCLSMLCEGGQVVAGKILGDLMKELFDRAQCLVCWLCQTHVLG